MSEKKSVGRNIAISLGVVVIALVVILAMIFTQPSLFGLSLRTTENEKPPLLVNVGLGAVDMPTSRELHVSGYVVNTGSKPAYNTRLHVVAYFATGAKAIDIEIDLGNGIISANAFVKVDEYISYSGGTSVAASSAELTPLWSNSP